MGFEVLNRGLKLVAAPRITEPDDVPIEFGERICLDRVARPGTGLIDAIFEP